MNKLKSMNTIDIVIIGGGMITYDLLLPSVYHLQRTGYVNNIKVCALDTAPLKALKHSKEILEAFPDQYFEAFPPVTEPEKNKFPELYKEVIAKMKPRQIVIVAMPDQFHYTVVMAVSYTHLTLPTNREL